MIYFANPELLYLLLAIPAIGLVYVLDRMLRNKRLAKFGNPKIIEALMPDASKYMPTVKIIVELSALLLLIIALARPFVMKTDPDSADSKTKETSAGIEIMVCLDVSNSMMASSTTDPAGVSRLQRAKFILEKMINTMTNDKIGLIVFAGESYTQLPITNDYLSAKMYLNSISPDMVPTQGTAIGSAIEMAINSFNPESKFQKAIVVITDAENFEDDAQEMAKAAAKAGIQVDVVGLGTTEGMPIPVPEAPGEYLTFDNGEQVLTAFDPKIAEAIAKAGHGIYIDGSSNGAVNELEEQLDKLEKTEYTRLGMPDNTLELYPIVASLALIMLLIDVFLPYSKIKWLRNINFFSK
ncbi:MAG: VWA domain-containing protein [Firmicutes bacterium]|nr:VWA domain-containing protein [Bacillota bacterium]MCM1400841.1 VWA domain-containing protein [Bacteroides sp.]MCM1476668.1 VWA domain-containing protein [Bacteroides sp.]